MQSSNYKFYFNLNYLAFLKALKYTLRKIWYNRNTKKHKYDSLIYNRIYQTEKYRL